MIKTQELQMQIEELTKQNGMMLSELEQMKQLISGNQSNSSGQNQNQNQNQDQNQAQGQNQNQGSSGGQQGQDNGQNQGQGGSGGQAAMLANELLKIKDMVTKLEEKTSQYVSSQTNGSLTEKEVVNLVLTLINGMVDWASEYVSGQASTSGQKQ